MRLLSVGSLKEQLTPATKMAMAEGAELVHAESVAQARQVLNDGTGFNLAMINVMLPVGEVGNAHGGLPIRRLRT